MEFHTLKNYYKHGGFGQIKLMEPMILGHEVSEKESPRLLWGSKILSKIGIKNEITKDSIKIYGNPNIITNKRIIIKKFLKDHRVFMTSAVAALIFGGKWNIYDKNSINTSFPSFLKKIKYLGAKFD